MPLDFETLDCLLQSVKTKRISASEKERDPLQQFKKRIQSFQTAPPMHPQSSAQLGEATPDQQKSISHDFLFSRGLQGCA